MIIILLYGIVAVGACVAAVRQTHLNIGGHVGDYGIVADL